MTVATSTKRPRISPLTDAELTPEARELLPKSSDLSGGRPLNIFLTLARHPKLFKRWMVFGTHVLLKSTVPARERELVILRTGWLCRSEYEFGQHTRIGRACGLSNDEIRRITVGPEAPEWSDRDRVLLSAADELHERYTISDETWRALSRDWSEQQIMDLIFAIGQYTLVSMVLNALGVELEDGAEGFPAGVSPNT
jgi:alkylhydroperoxidase family enzyme